MDVESRVHGVAEGLILQERQSMQTYDEIIRAWSEETWHMAWGEFYLDSPTGQRLLAMGDKAMPILLYALKTRRCTWGVRAMVPRIVCMDGFQYSSGNEEQRCLELEQWLEGRSGP